MSGTAVGLAVGGFDTEHGCECGFHPRLLQEATEVCSAVTASPSICRKQHVGCRELCGLDGTRTETGNSVKRISQWLRQERMLAWRPRTIGKSGLT